MRRAIWILAFALFTARPLAGQVVVSRPVTATAEQKTLLLTGPARQLEIEIVKVTAPVRIAVIVGVGRTCDNAEVKEPFGPVTFKPGDPRLKLKAFDVPVGQQSCLRVQTLDKSTGAISLNLVWQAVK